jgi:hypothetical protein
MSSVLDTQKPAITDMSDFDRAFVHTVSISSAQIAPDWRLEATVKLYSLTILTLALTFAGSGASAQDASVNPDTETQRCVNWIKATVPDLRTPDDADLRKLDPVDFCSGVQSGSIGGWYSIFNCGASPVAIAGSAPGYCTSSGQITAHEAWGAGFSSATRDGSDFLAGASGSAQDSQRSAATFFTASAVWMENLRVPAGMYKLMPSKSPDGWSLAIAKQGEWSDTTLRPQYLGSVLMKGSESDGPAGKHNLAIWTGVWAERCGGHLPNFDVRELHFKYGSSDLFVCIRPEQVPQTPKATMTER